MKTTGFVRKVDVLGRLTIPMELRKKMRIDVRDAVEIFIDEDYILLKKYEPCDLFTGEMDELIDYEGKKVSKKSIVKMAEMAGFEIR